MTLAAALNPLAPYALAIKAGAALALTVAIFWAGWHYGGLEAEADLAGYRATVAEDARTATLAAWDRAETVRKDVAEQAQELAGTLADQARENGKLRAELAEAKRRGTLTSTNPSTRCADLGGDFRRLWNNAAGLRPTAPARPTD